MQFIKEMKDILILNEWKVDEAAQRTKSDKYVEILCRHLFDNQIFNPEQDPNYDTMNAILSRFSDFIEPLKNDLFTYFADMKIVDSKTNDILTFSALVKSIQDTNDLSQEGAPDFLFIHGVNGNDLTKENFQFPKTFKLAGWGWILKAAMSMFSDGSIFYHFILDQDSQSVLTCPPNPINKSGNPSKKSKPSFKWPDGCSLKIVLLKKSALMKK